MARSYKMPKPEGDEWTRVLQAAQLVYLGQHKLDEVAESLGISGRQFRRWRKQDWWQEAMALSQEDSLANMVAKARNVVDHILRNGGDRERAQMARWLLERRDVDFAPLSERRAAAEKDELDELVAEFTAEELREFLEKKRADKGEKKPFAPEELNPHAHVTFAFEEAQ